MWVHWTKWFRTITFLFFFLHFLMFEQQSALVTLLRHVSITRFILVIVVDVDICWRANRSLVNLNEKKKKKILHFIQLNCAICHTMTISFREWNFMQHAFDCDDNEQRELIVVFFLLFQLISCTRNTWLMVGIAHSNGIEKEKYDCE